MSFESNNTLKFTEYDRLCELLKQYGWNKKGWGIPDGVSEYFTKEIQISPDQAKSVVVKLNNAKSKFEEAQILIGLIQSESKSELIASLGEKYTFRSINQLEGALNERNVKFPADYLLQRGGTFTINFNAPRTLSAVAYEKLITDLVSISGDTPEDNARRGEIIRAAFNEQTPQRQGITSLDQGAEGAIPSDINTLKNLNLSEISKSPASLRGEFEKVNKLSGPLQVAGWSVFFTKLRTEGYDIIFGKDPKNITVRTNNDAKGNQSEKDQRQKDIENQLRTLTESNTGVRKNILMGLLLQEGVFKNYIETNKNSNGSTKIESISVAEFQKYLQGGRTHSLAYTSLAAYDDALLREAAGIIPTQSEVDTTLRTLLTELQKKGVIDVNAPAAVAAAIPADLRDSFAGNLSLPSSPIILAGGGLLYGFMKKDGGFLQGLKFGLIGVLVAIFGGMGSDWLKKNLGYDLGFTLGEQKVGLMKLEKKVNDLRNVSEKNSRLTSSELAGIKALVGEFDTKWKNEASVSPVGPAVSGVMDGNFDISKRLSDSPELNAYEERINLYYLRAGGAIDSVELQRRLKEVDAKLAAAKASSTSGAGGSGGSAAPAAAASGAVASPAAGPASTIDVNKLSTEQQKLYNKITSDKAFIQSIDAFGSSQTTQKKVETAQSNAYLEYIFSDKFLKLPLEKYIYSNNPDLTFFRPTETLDPSLGVPMTMNNALLKKMLLLALTGSAQRQVISGKALGEKEKEDFLSKFPETNWKSKTTEDIVKELYK